jgi:hypothetical protein
MALTKKKFDLDKVKQEESAQAEMKPERFFDCGEAFMDAVGVPGPAMGHINLCLGHSDTGKSTAVIKTAMDAQKKGVLPVFIITENKWSFGHAKLMGFEVEEIVNEQTGNIRYDGDFLFRNDFQYVEQVTDWINHLLDKQAKGKLPYDLLFLWDSIGSIPCKMTFEGKGGKQHTASALQDKIGMGLAGRITSSRFASSEYTNTLVIVNQAWVELPDNPYGKPKIKARGGNAAYYGASYVFLFGNQKGSGTSGVTITKDTRKLKFGMITKISLMKNHINGLGFEDGKIMITPDDFYPGKTPPEQKRSIERYKREHGDYLATIFGGDISDASFKMESDEEPSIDYDAVDENEE